jgi:hypothetical protein
VLGFFETSGVQHHHDEDDDLLPLLRARAAALGRIEIAAAIDEIEREHATLDAQWRRLREALAGSLPGARHASTPAKPGACLAVSPPHGPRSAARAALRA